MFVIAYTMTVKRQMVFPCDQSIQSEILKGAWSKRTNPGQRRKNEKERVAQKHEKGARKIVKKKKGVNI